MAKPQHGFSDQALPAGTRIACRVEYDGTDFNGWQSQPGDSVTTVQDSLEEALTSVADCSVRVHCAGRTDTGVHAHCQIAHFDAPVSRSPKAWVIGGNANLPPSIRLHWATSVQESFHARFSALSRRYRYVIFNGPVRPALLRHYVTWHRRPLTVPAMHQAAQALVGEQDFSAFRAAACQSDSPMRCVQEVNVQRCGDLVVIDIAANAFLHHMVRNIAGSLIAVGNGREERGWIGELMRGQDRTQAADTAPAAGLYLVDVLYPQDFDLPATPFGPALIAGER